MTRHPLVFMSGPRSLFRLRSYWNDIPTYLREHGYEVFVIEKSLLKTLLDSFQLPFHRFHLISDASLEPQLIALARSADPKFASLTLAKNEIGRDCPKNKLKSLLPRRAFTAKKTVLETEDLKPLPMNIEILDVGDLSVDFKPNSWPQLLSLFLLTAHNLLNKGPLKVDAFETGQLLLTDWRIENRFLELAISLAERDAQWCDKA